MFTAPEDATYELTTDSEINAELERHRKGMESGARHGWTSDADTEEGLDGTRWALCTCTVQRNGLHDPLRPWKNTCPCSIA